MTIKKVKLVDGGEGGLTIGFVERPAGRKERKTTQDDQTPVHRDLKQAFANLAIHLAILTGYISVKAVKNIETPKPELSEGFHVTGISVKTGDDSGVVITGHRILENGKAVILNTPFTRFEESEESAYKFTDDLERKILRIEAETSEYVDGVKIGDDPQAALPFDQPQTNGNGLNTKSIEEAELVDADSDPAKVWKDGQRPNV